jgi:HK97 family phage major capsid protein
MRWIGDKLGDRFARAEGITYTTGNGVGRPRGILTYPNVTTAGVYQDNTVERINLGNASAITADGLIRLQNSVKQNFQGNSNFIMNRTTYGAVMLLKDGQGQYLFNNIPNSRGVFEPGLLGKPVFFGTTMPTVAANALSVAYGDFREGYCIVDRVGMTMLPDPYSQQGFLIVKARKRGGGGVINFDAFKIGVIAA